MIFNSLEMFNILLFLVEMSSLGHEHGKRDEKIERSADNRFNLLITGTIAHVGQVCDYYVIPHVDFTVVELKYEKLLHPR